jgi:hypothetical protein
MHASDTLGIDPLQPDGSDSDMARKKADGASGTEGTWNVTPNAFVIKGTEEWKAWVDRLNEHCGSTGVNDLVDAALEAFAKARKFKEPAPQRTARTRSLRG